MAAEQAEELRGMQMVPETPSDAPVTLANDCLTEPAVPAEVEKLVAEIKEGWEWQIDRLLWMN